MEGEPPEGRALRGKRVERLWLNDGSCVRLRAERPNHVWSYDFMMDRTHDGRPIKILTLVDEFTRECLAIDVERRLGSDNVLHRLTEVFVERGTPDHIRSDRAASAPPPLPGVPATGRSS